MDFDRRSKSRKVQQPRRDAGSGRDARAVAEADAAISGLFGLARRKDRKSLSVPDAVPVGADSREGVPSSGRGATDASGDRLEARGGASQAVGVSRGREAVDVAVSRPQEDERHGRDVAFGRMLALSPRVSADMSLGYDRLLAYDDTRTHDPLSVATEVAYRGIYDRLVERAKGDPMEVVRQVAGARNDRTHYSRRAAVLWAAAEGMADALRELGGIAWRRGADKLPPAIARELSSVLGGEAASGDLRLSDLTAEERSAWATALGRLRFFSKVFAEVEPGRKEDVVGSMADGRRRMRLEGEDEFETPDHDRDARRKQAELHRRDPDWKLGLWPAVEGSDSRYRDAMAVSFAIGLRPSELMRTVYVVASPDGRMQISAAGVKTDNGHGSVRKAYRYERGSMHPWADFLYRRAMADGEARGGMKVLKVTIRDEKDVSDDPVEGLRLALNRCKAYHGTVSDLYWRAGLWREPMWKEARGRGLSDGEMDALAVGLSVPPSKMEAHMGDGVRLSLSGGELEVFSARGVSLLKVEETRLEGGGKAFRTAAWGGREAVLPSRQAPWLARLFQAARKRGEKSQRGREASYLAAVRMPLPENHEEGIRTGGEAKAYRDAAKSFVSSLSRRADGRDIVGWSICPYVFRHQFMADCKALSAEVSGGRLDPDLMTEVTGNNSSWEKYGGRSAGKASGAGFVAARRTPSSAAGGSRGRGLAR